MSLLQTIKAAQLQARKNKDSVTTAVLTTLIGDAEMIGKNDGNRQSTDAEVIATIKKFITNATETLELVKSQAHANEQQRMTDMGRVGTEIGILKSFLPKQLSTEEVSAAIDAIITSLSPVTIKDMGKVMKTLKEKHEGLFDGTTASALVKEKLAKQA